MNDWLDVMLEEIDRKKREAEEARTEAERRSGEQSQSIQHQEEHSSHI